MVKSVLIGGISQESNTFSGETADRTEFQTKSECFGQEIREELRGTNTEPGGIIDVAEEEDVELIYSLYAHGGAGGPVERETYEFYAEHILDAAEAHRDEIDGVILPQHGALVAEHVDDADGELVERVRDQVGPDVPIVVTIDPNGNVSDRFVDLADAIVAYETTPHVDMGDTGRRGMLLLVRAMRGDVDPVMHVERPPVIPSAVKSTTLEPPLADIAALAREYETREDILKFNVCQGFWTADVPHMGFSIVAVTDGQEDLARESALEVATSVWDRREEFIEETVTAGEAVRQARELVAERGTEDGPVVIAEMHDNPGGGKPADGTKVLRALLDQGATNAGFAILRDPEAVAACVEAGVGKRVTLTLGGKTADATEFGDPIERLDGYVKAITDGHYRNTGPMKTGAMNDLGRAIRLQCGDADLEVVVTENRVQPWDAEVFRHVGIQPKRLDVVAVKSAVHYRADFGPMASEFISVDESASLEYDRITRPKYPIDPMEHDDYPASG